MAYAFTTAGSTPATSPLASAPSNPTSPFAKALTNAANPLATAPNMSTVNGPKYAPPPSYVAPTTPVKSITTTHPDNTQVTQTFHPETGMVKDTSNVSNNVSNPADYREGQNTGTTSSNNPYAGYLNGQTPKGGMLPTVNPQAAPGTAGSAAPASATQSNQGLVDSSTAAPATNAGLINSLATTANTNPLQSGGAYDAYSKALEQQNALKQGIASQNANIENSPIPLTFQQGREQVLARQNASQLDAAQQAVTQAQQALGYGIQEQGTQQSGLTSAASLTKPELSQYGQTYYQPLQAGQNDGSAGIQPGDPAYASLTQYAQLAAAGENGQIPSQWTSNPVLNAQINAMAKQINPNYDPLTTPLNTTTQANTNAQIGSANSIAGAATQQAISRIGNVTSNLTNFMQQWGINQANSPYFNQPMQAFISSGAGAGALAGFNVIQADLKAATSQLLNTPGVTPTGFTAELQSFDPSKLSPSEMNTYLQALEVAGQYQLNSYQTTSSSAYGSNTSPNSVSSVQPYSGTPTLATPFALPAPTNPAEQQEQNAPTPGKVIGGALLEGWGSITSALSGFGSFLSSL